ncbi:MAG: hypothetical protein IPO07_26505 [Haliscomenobacter sp.]|nr:hypothetical protein [Haliscomenobacter sp.]
MRVPILLGNTSFVIKATNARERLSKPSANYWSATTSNTERRAKPGSLNAYDYSNGQKHHPSKVEPNDLIVKVPSNPWHRSWKYAWNLPQNWSDSLTTTLRLGFAPTRTAWSLTPALTPRSRWSLYV